jgi:hypothetical protein
MLKTIPLQFKLLVVICVILGPTEPAVVVNTNTVPTTSRDFVGKNYRN